MSDALASSAAVQTALDPANPFSEPMATPGTEEIITSMAVDHFGTMVYVKALRHIATAHHPVILVHDINEHSDFYLGAAGELLSRGYSVYLYDLRGHGRSGRQLGHAPSFATHINDLLQIAAWVRFEESGKAPFVIGQGVGALIAMDFSKAYPSFCRGAVLSAPCFELASPVTLVRRLLIKFLADFMPMVRVPLLLRPKLTREKRQAQQGHGMDPYGQARFPGLTAVFTQELLNTIKSAEARFVAYRGAALVLCPERDGVCSFQNLKKQAAVHQEGHLEVISLSDTSHHVFTRDPDGCTQAVKQIVTWLAQREQLPNTKPEPLPADLNAPI